MVGRSHGVRAPVSDALLCALRGGWQSVVEVCRKRKQVTRAPEVEIYRKACHKIEKWVKECKLGDNVLDLKESLNVWARRGDVRSDGILE
jgi:hypothetical protein